MLFSIIIYIYIYIYIYILTDTFKDIHTHLIYYLFISAVELSLRVLERAIDLTPDDPNAILSYIHLLEVEINNTFRNPIQ